MNILDAAHMIGHDYPGGCSALGPRLGMSGAITIAEFGRYVSSCEQALRDGVVSRNELKQVEHDLVECLSKMTGLHRIILDKSGIQP